MQARNGRTGLALALALGALCAACLPGRRLLDATIERDGVVLVQVWFDVPDSFSELEALEVATQQTWTSAAEGTPVPRGELGPGAVLRLTHGSRPFVERPCPALRLVPTSEGTGWRTSPELVLEPELAPLD